MARADDDFDDDPPVEALEGSATPSAGAQEVAAMLVGLVGEVAKLHIFLHEADEEEFEMLSSRLKVFLDLVGQLPTEPTRKRKKLGFEVKKRKR